MIASFVQLNDGWNAEPNAPQPRVPVAGADVSVRFLLNAFQFPEFSEGDEAILCFRDIGRYRLGPTNDEGWHMGKCRFSRLAPIWGEFYDVSGSQNLLLAPTDWLLLGANRKGKHFLFYFRDETFECVARDWSVDLPNRRN